MRIRPFLSQKQIDLLFHCHIMSPFNYCPLVWMYCSKQAHSLLANIHKKALRARFNNFTLTYDELLQKSESVSIHAKNLQLMVCEVYKTINYLNPKIMWNSFTYKEPNKYSLRRGRNLIVPKARTSRAINSFDFRATIAWNQLPESCKQSRTVNEFLKSVESKRIYCECLNCAA